MRLGFAAYEDLCFRFVDSSIVYHNAVQISSENTNNGEKYQNDAKNIEKEACDGPKMKVCANRQGVEKKHLKLYSLHKPIV